VIIVRLKGGLGNQMFQYAAGAALANRLSTTLKFDRSLLDSKEQVYGAVFRDYELAVYDLGISIASKTEIRKYNPDPVSNLGRVSNKIKRIFRGSRLYIEPSHAFDPAFFRVKDDHCIVGAFQSEKYFTEIGGEIRNALTLKKLPAGLSIQASSRISEASCCAVHVRRGDYVTNSLYSKMLGAGSAAYYEAGVKRIMQFNRIDRVLVFSDDMQWCRENLNFGITTEFMDENLCPNDHHVQLHLMSLCNYFVISNSTYSWWAAWLSRSSNKVVIAPAKWFRDDSKEESDIIPRSWERIN